MSDKVEKTPLLTRIPFVEGFHRFKMKMHLIIIYVMFFNHGYFFKELIYLLFFFQAGVF